MAIFVTNNNFSNCNTAVSVSETVDLIMDRNNIEQCRIGLEVRSNVPSELIRAILNDAENGFSGQKIVEKHGSSLMKFGVNLATEFAKKAVLEIAGQQLIKAIKDFFQV
jgi:hypothetical protein